MKNKLASKLAAAGVIGALYAGLTYLFAFSSFTANQLRVAEALTLMPMLIPQASCGLAIGCFLSNLISGYGVADLIVGPLATLLAGYLTSRCKNYFWGAFWPVAVNAVAIGSMITILSGVFTLPALLVNMGQMALGQAIACYALGVPLFMRSSAAGLLIKNSPRLQTRSLQTRALRIKINFTLAVRLRTKGLICAN